MGNTTNYVYSGGKVIAEYQNGALTAEYIYAGAQLVATLDASGNPTYHYADQLSTRIETDASANVTRTYGHFPFGETWYETGNTDKWKFTSYERDAETGNDYAMAREYASTYGRFMQPDPARETVVNPKAPQTWNRYTYVEDSPVDRSDPFGLCDVVGAGLAENPGPQSSTQAMEQFAASIGAITVFPYAGMGVSGGAASVEEQALGINTISTQAEIDAINLAAADSQGPINLFGFSGDAQAIFSAVESLPAAVKSRINRVVLLSPGTGVGPLSPDEQDPPVEAFVYEGNGVLENLVTSGFDTLHGSYNCGHNSNCAFSSVASSIAQFAGSPCNQRHTLSTAPLGDFGGGWLGGSWDTADVLAFFGGDDGLVEVVTHKFDY